MSYRNNKSFAECPDCDADMSFVPESASEIAHYECPDCGIRVDEKNVKFVIVEGYEYFGQE